MSNRLDNDNVEVVCEGWLTKSPPAKRILRARWRRRYFILRHSGELPGQYFLWYYENCNCKIYTDWNCRLLKGKINLDQCEQVDAGLSFESGKEKYQHMFTIRTPKRTFYLAAESEDDMNKWVDCVCHVCGLKPFISDDTVTDDGDDISQATTGITEISPPVTPSTVITGPYIPISECFSGQPIHSDNDLKQFLLLHGGHKAAVTTTTTTTTISLQPPPPSDSYDQPRNLRPPEIAVVDAGSTPPPSPGSESVFTDDESVAAAPNQVAKKPTVNWETFPRPSDSSVDEDTPGNTATLKADRKFAKVAAVAATPSAPPRPPKPSHLATGESHTDGDEQQSALAAGGPDDVTYDFPRSHHVVCELDSMKRPAATPAAGRQCYTNAVAGQVSDNIFRYDFAVTVTNSDELPESPRSETGSTAFTHTLAYSNLPSPSYSTGGGSGGNLIVPPTPPAVNRELKPGRKCSDSTSNEPSPSLPTHPPPSVHRDKKKFREIQYLDLDLDSGDSAVVGGGSAPGLVKKSSENVHTPSTATVYKTVDFLKTEAFNRTRIEIEEERSRLVMAAESAL